MSDKTPTTASDSAFVIPAPALILGSGGLIPFVMGLLLVLIGPEPWKAFAWDALRSYAAVILSFLGAVHWGSALGERDKTRLWHILGWSVVPALLAWIGLLLAPTWGYALLLGGFVLNYEVDRRAVRAGRMPAWYGELRRWLTLGVVSILSVVLVIAVLAGMPR